MGLRIYNTLSREIEDFEPISGNKVNMYVCGPTVYDNCHLGHARSYISFDVIRRYLIRSGFDVNYISNITDVDDRVINRAKEMDKDPFELSKEFTRSYFEDMAHLGIMRADHHPKVTEHIQDILHMVQVLVEKGEAYVTDKGNVYYDLVKAKDKIGVLSHQTTEALLEGSGTRVETEDDKRFQLDFALWKVAHDDEPGWESPWGKGRPGWHIECSVMSMKYGGERLDIHGGGLDLVFPHHEAEILQSESYTGKSPFSKYWIHNGFLTIDKDKMSKSLDNFFTIKEVMENYSAKTIRFFILNTHYRRPIDFSDKHLEEAARAHDRIANSVINAKDAFDKAPEDGDDLGLGAAVAEAERTFDTAMDDDFNTREAVAGIFVLARRINEALSKGSPSKPGLRRVLDFFLDVGDVIGMFKGEAMGTLGKVEGDIGEDRIRALIDEREEARKAKDWAKADRIRDELKDLGIVLEDGKDGARWKRI